MVERTTESADVSQEPRGLCHRLRELWASCGPSVLGRLAQSRLLSLPRQPTTGRDQATKSHVEGLSLKILPGQEGPGCPRTKDVDRLPEGPPKALTSPAKASISAEPPFQASGDRKTVSMLVLFSDVLESVGKTASGLFLVGGKLKEVVST